MADPVSLQGIADLPFFDEFLDQGFGHQRKLLGGLLVPQAASGASTPARPGRSASSYGCERWFKPQIHQLRGQACFSQEWNLSSICKIPLFARQGHSAEGLLSSHFEVKRLQGNGNLSSGKEHGQSSAATILAASAEVFQRRTNSRLSSCNACGRGLLRNQAPFWSPWPFCRMKIA